MTPIGWRAWYRDGARYDSAATSVDKLPSDGLQLVIVYLDTDWASGRPYRHVLCGGDYLMWNGHDWLSTMTPPDCPTCRIFPGSLMPDDEFAALQTRAMAEETW